MNSASISGEFDPSDNLQGRNDSPDYKKDLWGHLVKVKAGSFYQSRHMLKRKAIEEIDSQGYT